MVNMALMRLLESRLLALVKYGQWSQDDAVNLFISLTKQYRNKTMSDFITQVSKVLYQIEIYKLKKSDLITGTEPGQFTENIEDKIKTILQEAKEKSLEEILGEIREQGDVEESILHDVKEIVSSVSSWGSPSPPAVATHCDNLKRTLLKLCQAVQKTKKWYPRLTQMVSWCILVLSGSSRLVQVGTGEGKSCIVAMFAAYCAFTGQSVDIITSSPVLAERDAKEWRPFYQELKITVDVNTNAKEDKDLRKCYKCQVVYGSTEGFAGDWLRHHFQRINVRGERKFNCVIVDEVDSLMLDKGLELVYLGSEMPAMQSLNVILARVWHMVNEHEHLDAKERLDLRDDTVSRKSLEERIKKDIVHLVQTKQNEGHIPGVLEHINAKLGTWIDNAFLAKTMTLGHEYILHKNVVIPVDYHSTGVVQNNMTWCNGLQQFLEMKHKIRLSDMSIISNFKSNVGLFKSYKHQIYGITGTLGAERELDALEKVYTGIKTCQIPSFLKRKLYEEDGIVIREEKEWVGIICSVIKEQVSPTVYRGPRAALIICETINRAEMLYSALKGDVSKEKLKCYTNSNEDNSKITGKEVTAGDVIIATNLAGRGTDLKVCPKVNKAGGLFVVQTFLPLNRRVEQQAFGRTARQGSPGSAQLIMCSAHFSESLKIVMGIQTLFTQSSCSHLNHVISTVLPLFEENFTNALRAYQKKPSHPQSEAMASALRDLIMIQEQSCRTTLNVAKQARDTLMQNRLKSFLEEGIPAILKKEELFSDYLNMLEAIYKQDMGTSSHEDIVSSLHECWGMWLLMKFDEDKATKTLRQQLKEDMQSAFDKLRSKQSPSSMVYHYIRSGNRLRHQGSLTESINMYTRAIEEGSCWVAIALYNRAISTLSKRDSGYIAQALADLEKAGTEVQSHMKQLTSTLTPMEQDSPLSKQFRVKCQVQELLMLYIQDAVEKLQMANSRQGEVQVTEKHVMFMVSLLGLKSPRSFPEIVREVHVLSSLGLDTIITLDIQFSVKGFVARMLDRTVKIFRCVFFRSNRRETFF